MAELVSKLKLTNVDTNTEEAKVSLYSSKTEAGEASLPLSLGGTKCYAALGDDKDTRVRVEDKSSLPFKDKYIQKRVKQTNKYKDYEEVDTDVYKVYDIRDEYPEKLTSLNKEYTTNLYKKMEEKNKKFRADFTTGRFYTNLVWSPTLFPYMFGANTSVPNGSKGVANPKFKYLPPSGVISMSSPLEEGGCLFSPNQLGAIDLKAHGVASFTSGVYGVKKNHNLGKSRCYVLGANPEASFDKEEPQSLFGVKSYESNPNRVVNSSPVFSPNTFYGLESPIVKRFSEEDFLLYCLGLEGKNNTLSFPILHYYGAWHGFPLDDTRIDMNRYDKSGHQNRIREFFRSLSSEGEVGGRNKLKELCVFRGNPDADGKYDIVPIIHGDWWIRPDHFIIYWSPNAKSDSWIMSEYMRDFIVYMGYVSLESNGILSIKNSKTAELLLFSTGKVIPYNGYQWWKKDYPELLKNVYKVIIDDKNPNIIISGGAEKYLILYDLNVNLYLEDGNMLLYVKPGNYTPILEQDNDGVKVTIGNWSKKWAYKSGTTELNKKVRAVFSYNIIPYPEKYANVFHINLSTVETIQ